MPAMGPQATRLFQIQPPACNTKIPIFVVTAAISVVITIIAAANLMIPFRRPSHHKACGRSRRAEIQEQNSQLRPAEPQQPRAQSRDHRQPDHLHQARAQRHVAALAQRGHGQGTADANQRQRQRGVGQVLQGLLQPAGHADLEVRERRGDDHADNQRVGHYAFEDAPRVRLDHRAIHRQHDGRQRVVKEDHQRGEDRAQRDAVVAVHAGCQCQADDPVVATKRALGVDASVFALATKDRPAPGHGKAHQGGDAKVDQQPRFERRVQVGMQNAKEQQRRHGNVEHQGRCGVDKVVIDPVDAL